jgi:enoyl-CoA hydratase
MDLANACALETSLFALVFGSADRIEGMTAFLEKRAAQFKGE